MLCAIFQSMTYLIPLVYLATYSRTLGFTSTQGAIVIAVNNALNAASKVELGLYSDYIDRTNMLFLCCATSMLKIYTLWLISTRGTFIGFCSTVVNWVWSYHIAFSGFLERNFWHAGILLSFWYEVPFQRHWKISGLSYCWSFDSPIYKQAV